MTISAPRKIALRRFLPARLLNVQKKKKKSRRETFAGASKTAREYARIKIDGLRLVGGNPDFTNAPGHGETTLETAPTGSKRPTAEETQVSMAKFWRAPPQPELT